MTVSPSNGEGGEKNPETVICEQVFFLMVKKMGNFVIFFFFSPPIWRPNVVCASVYGGEPRRLRIGVSQKPLSAG